MRRGACTCVCAQFTPPFSPPLLPPPWSRAILPVLHARRKSGTGPEADAAVDGAAKGGLLGAPAEEACSPPEGQRHVRGALVLLAVQRSARSMRAGAHAGPSAAAAARALRGSRCICRCRCRCRCRYRRERHVPSRPKAKGALLLAALSVQTGHPAVHAPVRGGLVGAARHRPAACRVPKLGHLRAPVVLAGAHPRPPPRAL